MTHQNDKRKFRLVLTGGGTAGHVWPHFALFDNEASPLLKALKEGSLEVYYFGSRTGMERALVERHGHGWRYVPIHTGKLRRYWSWRNFVDPFLVVLGMLQTLITLWRLRADAVFSKGGFVSAPVVWAAWLLRIPVVIHESDLSPALATRLSLPFATKALCAFDETRQHCPARYQDKVEPVGIPLRASLLSGNRDEAYRFFRLNPERRTLLIFGGSLGAASLNEKLVPALPELANRYNVIHLVGKGKSIPVKAGPGYSQHEFLGDEMKFAYAAADLALCRAGASSIFELAAARIPMILVPLGRHQSRGDQIENARYFESKGWAAVLWEKDLTTESAIAIVDQAMQNIEERKRLLARAPAEEAAMKTAALLWDIMQGPGGQSAQNPRG